MSIAAFWELHQNKKFNFDPPYQRRSVWGPDRQGFFVDSLLRNYPMPPIFLHQHIDTITGATSYDVVDGKQRLQSIIRFIEGLINVINESEQDSDAAFVGRFFSDLDAPELITYKKNFWRYQIPVEYIDTVEDNVLNEVFDRLNRNGAPLSKQELRNAKYHDSEFSSLVRELSQGPFWAPLLNPIADRNRFEHEEFISDLIFLLWKDGVQNTEGQAFDNLYTDAVNSIDGPQLQTIKQEFIDLTDWLATLNLDYDSLGIRGISHLYGLWSLGYTLQQRNVPGSTISARLVTFLQQAKSSAPSDNQAAKDYFYSTNSRTRSRVQRLKRLKALLNGTGQELEQAQLVI
ncbi:DUF262 domain-containing protein [Pelomonas sp. P7]|uniref:DUF262 domain-containing protein n=1 Tax=Pelomonas caseinilytica TaxID=2906763 RepID=A0ABS8XLG9_9BURK|nr:DUF262 domain-containing protein [Pelomonas sp. P7]MCE4539436.1 DUF262 domain-containing protein [Pelomonas sp. P7]